MWPRKRLHFDTHIVAIRTYITCRQMWETIWYLEIIIEMNLKTCYLSRFCNSRLSLHVEWGIILHNLLSFRCIYSYSLCDIHIEISSAKSYRLCRRSSINISTFIVLVVKTIISHNTISTTFSVKPRTSSSNDICIYHSYLWKAARNS